MRPRRVGGHEAGEEPPVPPPRRGEGLRSPASSGRIFEGRMPSLQYMCHRALLAFVSSTHSPTPGRPIRDGSLFWTEGIPRRGVRQSQSPPADQRPRTPHPEWIPSILRGGAGPRRQRMLKGTGVETVESAWSWAGERNPSTSFWPSSCRLLTLVNSQTASSGVYFLGRRPGSSGRVVRRPWRCFGSQRGGKGQ